MLSSSNTYYFNNRHSIQDTDSFDSAYTDTSSGLYSDYEKYVQIRSANIDNKFYSSFDKNLSKHDSNEYPYLEVDKSSSDSTLKRTSSSSNFGKLNGSGVNKDDTHIAEKVDCSCAKLSASMNDISHNNCEFYGNKDQDLVFENGHLKSGTLDSIINYLVYLEDNSPNKTTIFSILLSLRVFIPPHKLFKELFNRIIYESSTYGIYSKESLENSVKKFISILNEWTQMFPYDFRQQKMMNRYRHATSKALNMNIDLKDDIISITSKLLVDMRNLEMYESYLNRIHYEASMKLKKSVVETNIMAITEDAHLMAQQLAHIELDRLKHISAEEFIQYFSLDDAKTKNINFKTCSTFTDSNDFSDLINSYDLNSHDILNNKMTRTSTNLEAYIQWFNRLSNLVTTEIVKHLKRETRVKMIHYFIDVAYECFNIGNYNSLMAIIASLNTNSVSRLKKTWSKIDKSRLDSLQKNFEFFNNYSAYRQILKAAKLQAQQNYEIIVIPFFVLVMKDLTSLNDGIPNKLQNGHINFEKFWNIAKYISDILNMKNATCQFKQKSRVINYLLTTPLLTDDACILASYECEPPDNDNDRRHRDKLRLKIKENAYFCQSFD